MRRLVAPLIALALVTACSGGGDDAAPATTRRSTTTSSTSTSTTSTTAAPGPTTTTTAPVPPAPVVPPGSTHALMTRNGVVVPVEGQAAGGWSVRTPCGRIATVAGGTPLAGATVVLDPGHGGAERGAIGPNGLTEAALNLAVVQKAADALRRAGVDVVQTRTADYRETLDVRAELAVKLGAKAFVSVHHNAEPDGPSAKPGTETYYQLASAGSKRLAGLIYEEVVRALSQYGDVAWVADRDAGAKWRTNTAGADYYGILRRSAAVTGVLAELAYLSNAPEAALLSRPDVQTAEGEAVARGIVRYLTTNDPGSGFVTPYPRESPAGSGGGATGCVDPPLS